MKPAARLTDMHVCPMVTPGVPPIPHVGGPILPPGGLPVLIAGMPAATVGTPHVCSFPPPAVHPPSAIAGPGCPTVLIGGMPAARVGDLLTVKISISDKAELTNTTSRSRTNNEDASVNAFLGYESTLQGADDEKCGRGHHRTP